MNRIVVKVVIRPLLKNKRTWAKVNLKKLYPDGTVFYLRWLPPGATTYKVKSLGAITSGQAQIARASFVPEEVLAVEAPKEAKPKTLEECRREFLADKETTTSSDGTALSTYTIQTGSARSVGSFFSPPPQSRRTSSLLHEEVIAQRRQLRPAYQIAQATRLSAATVSRILQRAHLNRWRHALHYFTYLANLPFDQGS